MYAATRHVSKIEYMLPATLPFIVAPPSSPSPPFASFTISGHKQRAFLRFLKLLYIFPSISFAPIPYSCDPCIATFVTYFRVVGESEREKEKLKSAKIAMAKLQA
jgi:hypothetical protein